MQERDLQLWQVEINQQIGRDTVRIDQLVVDVENNKLRIDIIEAIPKKRVDLIKFLIPVAAILVSLILGTLGLEITTLFFILQHVAGTH